MELGLKDKVALITGASRGIGAASAKALAHHGTTVVINYLPGQTRRSESGYIKSLSDIALPLPGVHLSPPSTLKDQEIWIPFQSRRGCPLDCGYCSTATIEGRIIRKHDPKKVVEAISRYVEVGLDHFFFVDNTFNLPNSSANTLCEQLISSKIEKVISPQTLGPATHLLSKNNTIRR